MSKVRDYQSWKLQKLSNPKFAALYLNEIERSSPELVLAAIQNVVRAREVSSVAREAGVARENIYRAFSEQGNPTATTFREVLRAVGIGIKFEALEAVEAPTAATIVPDSSAVVANISVNRHVRSATTPVRANPGQGSYADCMVISVVEVIGGDYPDFQQSGIGIRPFESGDASTAGGSTVIFDTGVNAEHADVPLSLVARDFVQQREQEGRYGS